MISYMYQYLLDICFSMATKSSGRIKIRPELPVPYSELWPAIVVKPRTPPCLLMARTKN